MVNETTKYLPFISMSTITITKTTHKKSILTLSKDIPQKPYFADQRHDIILFHANCFDILPKIPENSIDMIFADPPYFLSKWCFNISQTTKAWQYKIITIEKGVHMKDQHIKKDIRIILGYLWQDEKRHYLESGYNKDHIFRVLRRLEKVVKDES